MHDSVLRECDLACQPPCPSPTTDCQTRTVESQRAMPGLVRQAWRGRAGAAWKGVRGLGLLSPGDAAADSVASKWDPLHRAPPDNPGSNDNDRVTTFSPDKMRAALRRLKKKHCRRRGRVVYRSAHAAMLQSRSRRLAVSIHEKVVHVA